MDTNLDVLPLRKILVVFWLVLNVCSSLSIVFLNKWVYHHVGFPNVTLTCVHFVFTSAGMLVCRCLGVFTPKTLPVRSMLPLSLTFCGFVVLTNLSLQYNTVGTYQVAKVMTTPCIVVIQTVFYNKTFSTDIKMTLVPITVGVVLNSYFDLGFNVLGVSFAASGVLVTSLYQVWVGEKQQQFDVSSMQLLYYQAPLSALLLACVIPFAEPLLGSRGFFGHWSADAVIVVTLTGIVAFLVNLTIFWIIGNTSPLTYNMSGHFKFALTLVGGHFIFQEEFPPKKLFAVVMTFVSIIGYTHFKLQENKKQTAGTGVDREPRVLISPEDPALPSVKLDYNHNLNIVHGYHEPELQRQGITDTELRS